MKEFTNIRSLSSWQTSLQQVEPIWNEIQTSLVERISCIDYKTVYNLPIDGSYGFNYIHDDFWRKPLSSVSTIVQSGINLQALQIYSTSDSYGSIWFDYVGIQGIQNILINNLSNLKSSSSKSFKIFVIFSISLLLEGIKTLIFEIGPKLIFLGTADGRE